MFKSEFSPCSSCVYRNTASKTLLGIVTCQAYQTGIPKDLLDGFDKDMNPVTHDQVRSDQDNAIIFRDVDDMTMDEIEQVRKQDLKKKT